MEKSTIWDIFDEQHNLIKEYDTKTVSDYGFFWWKNIRLILQFFGN